LYIKIPINSHKFYLTISMPVSQDEGKDPKRENHNEKPDWSRSSEPFFLTSFLTGFASGQEVKITVMNPRGIKPPIRRIPMAARPKTLDGKTIYIVDTRFPRTGEFVEELFSVLQEKYPKTTWVFKYKYGGYMDDDPDLWAEIKAKGHGMILAVGY
jgi:hypothetical protein